jgi:hypothetical protein
VRAATYSTQASHQATTTASAVAARRPIDLRAGLEFMGIQRAASAGDCRGGCAGLEPKAYAIAWRDADPAGGCVESSSPCEASRSIEARAD